MHERTAIYMNIVVSLVCEVKGSGYKLSNNQAGSVLLNLYFLPAYDYELIFAHHMRHVFDVRTLHLQ